LAAITFLDQKGMGSLITLKKATAQADTGQTQWIAVPPYANAAVIYLNWTAKAGNTPLMDLKLLEADPIALNDTYVTDLEGWDGITQLAAEDLITVRVGPHRASADDTGVDYHIPTILPAILGVRVTLDRTSADETYTYTLSLKWTT
jgi:hypothetical protein